MLIPYSIVVHLTYADDSWYDYFIYESQWGFFLTYASMLCASYAMHEDEAKNTYWHNAAVMLTEISFTFNIMITVCFWAFIAPTILPSVHDPKEYFLYVAHHTMPIVCSILDLYLTKMYFLKRDYKIVFWAGMIYTCCSWMAAQFLGI